MSSRMRVTKGHTGNRRSHHHLKTPRLSKCVNCGAYHLRHRVCPECGHYRGKMVVDILAKQEKKIKKQAQEGQASAESTTENKDAEKAPDKEKSEGKKNTTKKEDK